jgi:hypothetical protein
MVLTRLTITSTTKTLSIREAMVADQRLRSTKSERLFTLYGCFVRRQLVLVRVEIKVELMVMLVLVVLSNVVKPCHSPDTCMELHPNPSTPCPLHRAYPIQLILIFVASLSKRSNVTST